MSAGSSGHRKKKGAVEQPLAITEKSEATEDFRHITRQMSNDELDTKAFVRHIWAFIFQFTCDQTAKYDELPLLLLLKEFEKIVSAEPTVIELKEKVCIIGDLQGHGDSLVTLLCLCGIPPNEVYVFLGSFSGLGFAPHETLFMLLALKVRYPRHIYLIKGSGEDSEVLKAQDFVAGLQKRGLSLVCWTQLIHCLDALPLAVLLNNAYLCLHGGIGPQLLKNGINELRRVCRPPKSKLDVAITMECQWASYRGNRTKVGDGSPVFGEKEVNKFCESNNLLMVIRSRQVVSNGILNCPERVITVWSAACYLDNFHNAGAVLKLDSNAHTASIIRFKVVEEEPKSLDDYRPAGGRNSRTV